uniref:TMEM9 family protein n=1 Tax=Anopheles merus TaxID=30066 RepID=A0A182UYU8_ANOME
MNHKLLYSITLVIIFHVATTQSQSYEDKRCKCICPSFKTADNTTQKGTDRMLIIDNVPPNKCNCDGVILPRLVGKIKGKGQEICPRCDCKYENRNTTIIKVVVIIVIWIISLLVIYMLFLMCLDPLLNKRVKANYQEHTNEDVIIASDSISGSPGAGTTASLNSGASSRLFRDTYRNKYSGSFVTTTIAARSSGSDEGSESEVDFLAPSHHRTQAYGDRERDDTAVTVGNGQDMHVRENNVLNRVGHQQDKWKRQVREQRRNIYDRHTMLN